MPKISLSHRLPTRKILGFLWATAFFFSFTLFATNASATVMKYADVAQLIEISDIIVQGTVAEQKVYFDPAQGRVVTDTTFKIERKFLGKVEGTVTIQQWRGTHKGITSAIPGDPNFEKGEEVIVFLHRGTDGVVALSAMGQSKFSIFPTAQGKLVSRDFSDLGILLQPAKHKNLKDLAAQAPGQIVKLPTETRAYDSFIAELEALVAGIKGGQ